MIRTVFQKSAQVFLATVLLFALVSSSAAAAQPKKVLVVTVTMEFFHTSTTMAEKFIPMLGEKNGWTVVDIVKSGQKPRDPEAAKAWTEKVTKDLADKMNPTALKEYDAVIFSSTTGVLPLPDKQAFLDWIKSGKSFIAIHAGADTFHGPRGGAVDPYIEMVGGEFKTHGAQVKVEAFNLDPTHPATKHLGKSFVVYDEIYQFFNYDSAKVRDLLTMDKHPNNQTPGTYPVSWCKMYGSGRVFYTSFGHREDMWDPEYTRGGRKNEPEVALAYQQHLVGGIRWALGLDNGQSTPQDTQALLKAANPQAAAPAEPAAK